MSFEPPHGRHRLQTGAEEDDEPPRLSRSELERGKFESTEEDDEPARGKLEFVEDEEPAHGELEFVEDEEPARGEVELVDPMRDEFEFFEDEEPTHGEFEFFEDEEPLSSGSPVYREMPEHFGDAWCFYVEEHLRWLGQWWSRLTGSSPAVTGPADEFIQDEAPTDGLPDLCTEYELRYLPRPLEEEGR